MSLIQKITPLNAAEEKRKFVFDPEYNPQFVYPEQLKEGEFEKYGPVSSQLVDDALKIVDGVIKKYGSENAYLAKVEGEVLNKEETEAILSNYLQTLKLEKGFVIQFSKNQVSRTMMDEDVMSIRLPIDYRKLSYPGVLNHEIGTHYIKTLNDRKQPWRGKRQQFSLRDHSETEEGIAVVHQLLDLNDKSAWLTSLYYLATYWASISSFADLNKKLKKYIDDPDRRWKLCLRVKRGMTDTSQPGGFSKVQLYFSGLKKVVVWLRKHDYSLEDLYLGKVAIEDLALVRAINVDRNIFLPPFYQNKADYSKKIDEIFTTNFGK